MQLKIFGFLISTYNLMLMSDVADAHPLVPVMFISGDSVVHVGNILTDKKFG